MAKKKITGLGTILDTFLDASDSLFDSAFEVKNFTSLSEAEKKRVREDLFYVDDPSESDEDAKNTLPNTPTVGYANRNEDFAEFLKKELEKARK